MKKQLVLSFLAVALLIVISSAPFTLADCDDSVDVNQRRQPSCDPQRLNQCRDYLRGQENDQEEEEDRPSSRCCKELRRMPQQCRCDAIQQVFDSLERGGEQQLLLQRARQLPRQCNLSPGRCDIRPSIFMPGTVY